MNDSPGRKDSGTDLHHPSSHEGTGPTTAHGEPDPRGQAFYDNSFRDLIGSTGLTGASTGVDRDRLDVYVRRIAGSVFCGSGIDPSVVSFATSRAADRWGRDETEVDVMVGDVVLRTTAALMMELR